MTEPRSSHYTPPPDHAATANHSRRFSEEVRAHDSSLKAYLRSTFPTVRDIDDVAQESYIRLWRTSMVHEVKSARGLLFKIARHLAIDIVRRHQAAPLEAWPEQGMPAVAADQLAAADILAYNEKVLLIGEALAALPQRCREILILRKLQNVPQKQIARQLDISERTVESQVARGMKLCEVWLRKRGLHGFYRDER